MEVGLPDNSSSTSTLHAEFCHLSALLSSRSVAIMGEQEEEQGGRQRGAPCTRGSSSAASASESPSRPAWLRGSDLSAARWLWRLRRLCSSPRPCRDCRHEGVPAAQSNPPRCPPPS